MVSRAPRCPHYRSSARLRAQVLGTCQGHTVTVSKVTRAPSRANPDPGPRPESVALAKQEPAHRSGARDTGASAYWAPLPRHLGALAAAPPVAGPPHLCGRQRTAPSEGAPRTPAAPWYAFPCPLHPQDYLGGAGFHEASAPGETWDPQHPHGSHEPENQAQGSVRNRLHFPDSAQNEAVRTAPKETGRASGCLCAPGKGLDHNLDTLSTVLRCRGAGGWLEQRRCRESRWPRGPRAPQMSP